jgi:hypothetical protein
MLPWNIRPYDDDQHQPDLRGISASDLPFVVAKNREKPGNHFRFALEPS